MGARVKYGELFVPKMPSYRITDVAEAVGPNCKKEIIGVRPGEKIHEEMITSSDSISTIDLGKYYAILPSDRSVHRIYDDLKIKYSDVPQGFEYNSGENEEFLTVEEIRNLIKENIDSNLFRYNMQEYIPYESRQLLMKIFQK